MAHFLLIPGMGHGAWAWERVMPLLAEAGHGAHAVELPGMGEDRTPLATLTLVDWIDHVASLASAAPEPVILVGHSRGGHIASAVAEAVPDAVAMLVYVAGVLLPDGCAARDLVARYPECAGTARLLVPEADGPMAGKASRLGPGACDLLCNATALNWCDRAAGHFTPEPHWALATPVTLTPERFGRVPRAYVECDKDRAIPLSAQRGMRALLPCDPVITLAADHSPFYSAPGPLAAALGAIAAFSRKIAA